MTSQKWSLTTKIDQMKKLLLWLMWIPTTLGAQSLAGPEAKFIYELSYDMYLSDRPVDDLNQAWYSNGHAFYFMGEKHLGDHMGLGYGFGFSVHNMHNNLAFVEVQPDPLDGSVLTLKSDSAFNINEQNFAFLDVPLEIRYRGRSNTKGGFFRAAIGAKVGYRIYSAAYFRADDYAVRQYRVFTNAPWRVRSYARIGWGKVTVFAGYEWLPTVVEQWPGFVPAEYQVNEFHMFSVGLALCL